MKKKYFLIGKDIEIWAYPVRYTIAPYIYMEGKVVDYKDGDIIFEDGNTFAIKDFGVIFRVKENR